MAGYVIARIQVTDPEKYEEYRSQAGATVEQYGGRYIVRGGECTVCEGEDPGRMVVLEFDSVDQARRWYDSPQYRPLAEIRQASSDCDVVIVAGT